MRARVGCNRYAPGYRSVSVRIQKKQFFMDVYPRNVCLPRINNTIHRKVFVCRGQKSTSNQSMTHYHTVPNALNCRVLSHIAHTVHNAITTFYIKIHFNRSQNVVEIAKTDYCGFGRLFLIILLRFLKQFNDYPVGGCRAIYFIHLPF